MAVWRTFLTDRGFPYRCVGEGDAMPGIPRLWLRSIVYLYASEADAHTGSPLGGTGFLMSMDPSPGLPMNRGHVYVVTAAHVIEGGCTIPRVNTQTGRARPHSIGKWICHPDGDDVAVAALELAADMEHACVPFEMAVPPKIFDDERLSPGDEAFFIGRFAFRDGKTTNTPTVRFGSIAQIGGDPVRQERRSGVRYQESILVECHSLSGFSGSPVFAYRGAHIRGDDNDPNTASIVPQVGNRVYLLGVDWGSDPWTADVRDKSTGKRVEPREYVSASSGMAMVVPAWKIQTILDDPCFVKARKEREDELRKKLESTDPDPAVMDSAEYENDEFTRFETLTRELVEKPKPSKDEKGE